jgi:hypothetical protein
MHDLSMSPKVPGPVCTHVFVGMHTPYKRVQALEDYGPHVRTAAIYAQALVACVAGFLVINYRSWRP